MHETPSSNELILRKQSFIHIYIYIYIYIYVYIYVCIYVNVKVYEIQRGLNNAQKGQIELYRLPQKVTTACFILRKNLQVTSVI